MTNEEEKEQPAREATCCYKLGRVYIGESPFMCEENVQEGQTLCVAHRSERTKEELELFGEIVRNRMERTDEYRYDFRGFRFPEHFGDFQKVTFEGRADFWQATFTGYAHFEEATFTGYAHFKEATFECPADFWHATFTGSANFWHATFTGPAYFMEATFTGGAYFFGATFTGNAVFNAARFTENAYFRDAQFMGNADFENVGFDRSVDFQVEGFGGDVNCYGATLPPSGRFGSAREWSWRWWRFWKPSRITNGRGESFFRFAKQVNQNMGEYQEAGDFHYEERRHALYRRVFLPGETKTRRLLNLMNPFVMIPALVEFIFGRIIFGYGERPGRIVAAAAVIVGFCAWIYDYSEAIINQSGEALRGLEHAVYFSIVTFTTLGFGDYAPVPGHPILRVAALEAVAGAFLMAAFIVTLARRWGRG